MPYKNEVIYATDRIEKTISFSAVLGVMYYLDSLSHYYKKPTPEDARHYIHQYFAAAIQRRTEADEYCGIYNPDLFDLIDKMEDDKDLTEAVEKQCLRAFLFGYFAGAEDRDRLQTAKPGNRCYNGLKVEVSA